MLQIWIIFLHPSEYKIVEGYVGTIHQLNAVAQKVMVGITHHILFTSSHYISNLLPRIYQIIAEIQRRFVISCHENKSSYYLNMTINILLYLIYYIISPFIQTLSCS